MKPHMANNIKKPNMANNINKPNMASNIKEPNVANNMRKPNIEFVVLHKGHYESEAVLVVFKPSLAIVTLFAQHKGKRTRTLENSV